MKLMIADKTNNKGLMIKTLSSLLILVNFIVLSLGVEVSMFYAIMFSLLFIAGIALLIYSIKKITMKDKDK